MRDGLITLERMHFADEIRALDEIAPDGRVKPDKRELKMASDLIERLHGDFEPERYEDTYRDTLCEIIKRKRKGDTVTPPGPEEREQAPDLIAALKASIERSSGDGRSGNGAGDAEALRRLSKDELYEHARERDVAGRSDMSKKELLAALTRD